MLAAQAFFPPNAFVFTSRLVEFNLSVLVLLLGSFLGRWRLPRTSGFGRTSSGVI